MYVGSSSSNLVSDGTVAGSHDTRTPAIVLAPGATSASAQGSLLGAFAESMGSGGGVNMLLYRLKDSPRPLPAELCDIAERAVAAYGFRASSIQYNEAGTA